MICPMFIPAADGVLSLCLQAAEWAAPCGRGVREEWVLVRMSLGVSVYTVRFTGVRCQ